VKAPEASVEEREFVVPEVAALGEDAIVDAAASLVVKVKEEAASIDNEVASPVEDAAAVLSDAAEAPLEEELDKAAEVAPLVSCGALDLVKASKHAKTHSPNVEAAFNEDVQPTSSLEDAGGSSGDGDTVITVQPICSFLPAQLSEEEFEESSLPLVVHDPSFASGDGEAKVPDSLHAVTEALLKNRLYQQSLKEALRQVELKLHKNEMQRHAVSLVEN
jgi:hypothetical protein